jgi:hypothetical protein
VSSSIETETDLLTCSNIHQSSIVTADLENLRVSCHFSEVLGVVIWQLRFKLNEKGIRMPTVYSFKVYDIRSDDWIQPALKSTKERIDQIRGTIIIGTAEEVNDEDVDENGRCRPRKE